MSYTPFDKKETIIQNRPQLKHEKFSSLVDI